MEEDIKKLLEENLKASEEIKEIMLKTRSYLRWLRVLDLLKLLLIVIPLVAAWIYLPQFFESFSSSYGAILPGLIR